MITDKIIQNTNYLCVYLFKVNNFPVNIEWDFILSIYIKSIHWKISLKEGWFDNNEKNSVYEKSVVLEKNFFENEDYKIFDLKINDKQDVLFEVVIDCIIIPKKEFLYLIRDDYRKLVERVAELVYE